MSGQFREAYATCSLQWVAYKIKFDGPHGSNFHHLLILHIIVKHIKPEIMSIGEFCTGSRSHTSSLTLTQYFGKLLLICRQGVIFYCNLSSIYTRSIGNLATQYLQGNVGCYKCLTYIKMSCYSLYKFNVILEREGLVW